MTARTRESARKRQPTSACSFIRREARSRGHGFLFDDFLSRVAAMKSSNLPTTYRSRSRDASRSESNSCPAHTCPKSTPRSRARLRRAADRPGGRVRLLRIAGDQGAARGGDPTDPGESQCRDHSNQRAMADRVYLVAVTPEFVSRYRQGGYRRDAPLVRGQTALDCGLALHDPGILQGLGVACWVRRSRRSRDRGSRRMFVARLAEIGVKTARGAAPAAPWRRRASRGASSDFRYAAGWLLAGRKRKRDREPASELEPPSCGRFAGGSRRCWSRNA